MESIEEIIVQALINDEEFMEKVAPDEDSIANYIEEYLEQNPIRPMVEEAITEHNVVLDLTARVEELEKKNKSLEEIVNQIAIRLDIELCPRLPTSPTPPSVVKFEKRDPVGNLTSTEAGVYEVMEDSVGTPFLVFNQGNHNEIEGLYQVTFKLPSGPVTYYVLAQSIISASDQAFCNLREGYDMQDQDSWQKIKLSANVVRIPMMIGGWGSNQF